MLELGHISFFLSLRCLRHGLSYIPHATSLPLPPPLPFGGGMGCCREEGALAAGGAAFFLHHNHSRCQATSPHLGAVTALHERKTVPPEMSCSSCYLLHKVMPASPIPSDATGKLRRGLAAISPCLSFSTALPVT